MPGQGQCAVVMHIWVPLVSPPNNSIGGGGGQCDVQGDLIGCRTGNGGILSSSQVEPGQAIKSDVALFPCDILSGRPVYSKAMKMGKKLRESISRSGRARGDRRVGAVGRGRRKRAMKAQADNISRTRGKMETAPFLTCLAPQAVTLFQVVPRIE